MTLAQLFTILIGALFFGFLCSFLAKKRGVHQGFWFLIGFFLGIFGVVLFYVLPLLQLRRRQPMPPKQVLPPRLPNELYSKQWFYLDQQHRQIGPIELTNLSDVWKKKEIDPQSYIWGEGMAQWKKLHELPEILDEISKNSRIESQK